MLNYFDILKASSGVPVDDPWAMLWAQGMAGEKWQLTTLTGTLPLSFKSKGAPLTDYKLYGTAEGAGENTGNLWNGQSSHGYIDTSGTIFKGSNSATCIIFPCEPNTVYKIKRFNNTNRFAISSSSVYPHDGLSITPLFRNNVTVMQTSVTTPSDAAYLIIYTNSNNVKPTIAIVENGDYPAHYEPYGYKLPITVESGETENLWDLESSWSNSETDGRNYFDAYLLYQDKNTIVGISFLTIKANGRYSITLEATDIKYDRIRFKHNGATKDLNIGIILVSFSKQDTYTITFDVLGFDASVINGIRLENIMLTKGSAPPDHYIPYHYSTTTPIYIGDAQLMDEEYVDYEEQKIYKRTENLVPEIRINNGWRPGYLNSANGAYVANNAYGEWLSPFIELKSITAVSILYKPVDNNPSLSIYFFDANDEYIGGRSTTVDGKATFDSFPSATAKIRYAYRTWHKTEQEIIQNEDWTCLVEGSTPPETYIPYLQPIDPPVALPELSTYQGENTLSCSEGLGDGSITGYIKEASQ